MIRSEIVVGTIIGASIVIALGMVIHRPPVEPPAAPVPVVHEDDVLMVAVRRPAPVIEEPEAQAVEISPGPTPAPEPAQRLNGRYMKQVVVRAYTPMDEIDRDSPYRDWRTSINKDTRQFPNQWGIAADPRLFPYGTRIRIPGYTPSRHFPEDHFWPVDDTGGRIRQMYSLWRRGRTPHPQIEVRFIHERSARRWGAQVLWVEVEPPSRP